LAFDKFQHGISACWHKEVHLQAQTLFPSDGEYTEMKSSLRIKCCLHESCTNNIQILKRRMKNYLRHYYYYS